MSTIPEHNVYDYKVTEAWEKKLAKGGYEPPPISLSLRIKIAFLTRTWRRILRHTRLKLSDPVSVLEFGCGGGAQLIPLFANGWACVGIDCSKEVLFRARQHKEQVVNHKLIKKDNGSIHFIHDDFLDLTSDKQFDMTFQFGVLEHFLSAEKRKLYMHKMFDTVKPGGFVVNFVPNGEHLFRKKQKALQLGGYDIPEIDYSVESLKEEMLSCGASYAHVLPHDLMGSLKIREEKGFKKLLNWGLYIIWQTSFLQKLPMYFQRRHAFSLIGIGIK
jgi:2-polyprenyl-3-methyl-5-hydroxy-6-metoxy-1,4-benzoquinol methylase